MAEAQTVRAGRKIHHQANVFLILYALFLILGGVGIALIEKGNEILYFNTLHTPFFNQLFSWVTRLAELPMLVFILLFALRVGYGKGIVLAMNSMVVFGVTAILKHLIFSDRIRPAIFFEGRAELQFIENMEINRYHSFPSGHTASAFALFFMLSLLVDDRRWQLFFFLLALLVGVSRVYLFQHFFEDVYVGSIVGVSITAIFYLSFVRSSIYERISWRDRKLFR